MSETTLAQGLYSPSLTLYAFHLRTDISQGPEQTSAKADQLWEQLVELGNTLQFPALQDLKQELICYQNGQYQPNLENQLTFKRQSLLRSNQDELECNPIAPIGSADIKLSSFCPFRLHDTYAVDLTFSCNGAIFLEELEQLNPKKLLLPQHIKASIGQTLLLYGQPLLPADNEQLQRLADDCVAQLLDNQIQLFLTGEGKLLGNQIFVYETLEIEPSKRCHILVWFINPDTTPTDEQLTEVSEQLLELLCAYHKILYAYDECQWCFYEAEKLYSELEEDIKDFQIIVSKSRPDRLKKFKQLLAKLPTKAIEYSKHLRDLADHETTIVTNIKNYESRFKKLSELGDDNLSFLKEFIELTHNKYKAQIQVYRQHLEPGAKLFQQLIDTVQGMVAIDRAELEAEKAELDQANEAKAQKREQQLERVITLVGTGLAVSSISTSVMPNPSEKYLSISKDNMASNFALSFLFDVVFHILIGVIFAIVMGFVIYLRNAKTFENQ
ncbi:hypothetical protein [Nostoc sp. FACHB-133]|uniref:hypothetical protein n=1 Tax=Nostoc sp. FACHB-133 TaxID=2692835 RepID=UPI00168A1592|nr:hypothetical protein [Nostoc sp. FACHB-133]MBD2525249.1 hypothetical protein [Nostoc sp. FACHB-133]